MNRSNAYIKASEAIGEIHTREIGELTSPEKEWIKLIFTCFDIIDDYLDNLKSETLRKERQQAIIGLFCDELSSNIGNTLPEEIVSHCMELRSFLNKNAILQQENNLIDEFRRVLKLAFALSNKLRNTENIQKYFQYSIIEGRISGKLVGFGLSRKDSTELLKGLGGLGNIVDDIKDHAMDYSNGEKRLTPSTASYLNGVLYITREVRKNKKLLTRILSNGHGSYVIRGFVKYLFKQLIHSQN